MAQVTSGEVLREARERKGLELSTVARRLRIRPDILRAIEANDFDAMPPKGYARNMINAYARLLGLNPTEIVNMYLDEAYARQVAKARNNAAGSGFVMEKENRRSRNMVGRDPELEKGMTQSMRATGSTERVSGGRGLTRHLYDDRTQYSHDNYGAVRSSEAGSSGKSRDFRSHHSGYSSQATSYLDSQPGRKRNQRTIQVGQTPMQYSASRLPALFQSRLALGIAIAAVAILVFVLIFFVFLRGGQSTDEDVSNLQVSGVNNKTEETEASSTASVVERTPTSAHIVYTVADGASCEVDIYVDGKYSTSESLEGPVEKTAETTTTWTIATWEPENLKITVNSEEVTLEPKDDYGGMYAYTVDFPAILEQWNKAHGTSSTNRQSAVANATNAATQAQQEAQKQKEQEELEAQQAADEDEEYLYDEDQDYYYDEDTDDYYYDGSESAEY